jgi:hypothetical protein
VRSRKKEPAQVARGKDSEIGLATYRAVARLTRAHQQTPRQQMFLAYAAHRSHGGRQTVAAQRRYSRPAAIEAKPWGHRRVAPRPFSIPSRATSGVPFRCGRYEPMSGLTTSDIAAFVTALLLALIFVLLLR